MIKRREQYWLANAAPVLNYDLLTYFCLKCKYPIFTFEHNNGLLPLAVFPEFQLVIIDVIASGTKNYNIRTGIFTVRHQRRSHQ